MGNPMMEGDRLPKDVIICRFGSAFSTLTVMVLDESIHRSIQKEMNELEVAEKLEKPNLTLNERICFRDHRGDWIRGRIKAVHNGASEGTTTADIVLEDSKQLLLHVDAEALVAMPAAIRSHKWSLPYFVSGLEPYSAIIAHKDKSNVVTAQLCAEALNMTLRSRKAYLSAVTGPSAYLRAARFTRIFVATLKIERNLTIPEFIRLNLRDYVIMPLPEHMNYFTSVSHPDVVLSMGVTIMVPYVSENEVCEVVSLRKNQGPSLRIGLRLLQYANDKEYLFERLLGGLLRPFGENVDPPSVVSICENGTCTQRGVRLKSGKILGVDTLDLFDPTDENVEVGLLPHSLAYALPHMGVFIDWNMRTARRQPAVGDFVLVTKLQPQYGTDEWLQYSYESVQIFEQPTPIIRRGNRLHVQTESLMCEKPKKNQKTKNNPRISVAEWYGLTSPQATLFERIFLYGPIRGAGAEAMLSKFGEDML